MPFSSAHLVHWRDTEPVESTSTPSRSNRIAEQGKIGIAEFKQEKPLTAKDANIAKIAKKFLPSLATFAVQCF
jgi:hypothetical protein